ncbi:hypothetical protein NW820_07375, partial [Synechococcus sp. R55.7]|uniref:hypothetical protein n=1 Tax=Synechococcus sp. R55.7 TaxID=2964500 RepID=UPI0039C0F080
QSWEKYRSRREVPALGSHKPAAIDTFTHAAGENPFSAGDPDPSPLDTGIGVTGIPYRQAGGADPLRPHPLGEGS